MKILIKTSYKHIGLHVYFPFSLLAGHRSELDAKRWSRDNDQRGHVRHRHPAREYNSRI